MSIFTTVLSFYVTLSVLSLQETVLLLGRVSKVVLCGDFTLVIQSLLQVGCLAYRHSEQYCYVLSHIIVTFVDRNTLVNLIL
jgi:hypothetical protein